MRASSVARVDGGRRFQAWMSGRSRFKIENERFNALKNGGYELSHNYSRKPAVAMKNYVGLLAAETLMCV